MNEFKRKQGVRIGLSLLAVIAAVLFLTGIIGGKPMTYRIGENIQETVAAEQGFGGEVTVHTVLNEDGTVKSLSIDTPAETDGLGKRASEPEFTDQFIGKAGPFAFGENGVEALSGATVTSDAALKAINRTLTGEPEEPAEEQPAEEQPAEEPAEEQPAEAPAAEEQPAEEQAPEEPAAEQPAETEEPAEEKPGETPAGTEEGQASSGLVYGSYFSEKETNFSTIRVTVATKNDEITDCIITSEAKNEGSDFLTDEIRTAWARAIVDSQSADADAITGASLTFSAGAVQEAVAEIQQQIAGEPAAEEPPAEEPAEEQPAEEKEPAEEKPEETPAGAAEGKTSSGLVYGSYLSEKETDFSTIRVIVATKNDEITDCIITSEARNEGSDFLTDEIRTAWARAIVDSQSADTDAITGASLTFSAGAVQEAVAEIQRQITGGPAAEEPPAEEPAEEKPEGTQAGTDEGETSSGLVYGSYLAVKETDFSTIRVIISTRKGEITDCRIYCDGKEGQTDLVTDENEAAWAKAIVETQGAEPDTVTGATVSSDAVREAVAEIMERIR